jgi:hypothetical protein
VTVTDLEEAVALMQRNIMLNEARRTSATELCWGKTDLSNFSAPYDVVLMAEVAYLPETYAPLAATISSLCSQETLVLHGLPPPNLIEYPILISSHCAA